MDFWDTIVINAKGETSPCCQYPLSSYTGSMEKMQCSVNSPTMLELRKNIVDGVAPKGCEGCHYLYAKDPLYS